MFRKITIAVICALALIGSARAAKVWLLGNGGAGTPLGVSGGGSVTNYYVANGGSDAANGLTPATAWQTITHVNAQTLAAGTTVLFDGGQTFSGGIALTTSNAPSGGVTIGSYGGGQATISSGNSAACLTATDVSAVTISNVSCTGGGNTVNTTPGISIVNDQAGNTKLAGPTISGVTVSGYGGDCIQIAGTNGSSGFVGIYLSSITAHDTTGNATDSDGGNACIRIYSAVGYPNNNIHSNVTLSGTFNLYNLTGKSGLSTWSGSGIVVSETNGLVTASGTSILVHDFGANANNSSGPCGVWTFDSQNIHYSNIEVYHGLGSGSGAGCGVDLDGGVSNSSIAHFWAHDNNGPGAMMFAYNDGSITTSGPGNSLSWFVTQNNMRNGPSGSGEILVAASSGATYTNPQVFNFDCYAGVNGICLGQATTTGTIAGANARVNNGLLYGVSGDNLVNVAHPGTLALDGNDYVGSTDFSWSGSNYTTYASFISSSGQESVNGGHTFAPQLYVPGGGFGTGGYAPSQMMAYNPQSGSPVVGAGINLQTQFGINPGTQDFFGNAITAATLPIGAGAADFGTFTASCTQASTFLALTTGFSKLDNVNYNSWICGENFDGDLALMDVAYLLAAPNHAAMLLDVSGNGHNLTEHGTVTFTARTGIASDGTTGYEDTGWNVNSGPNYTQNSVTDAGYDLTGCGAIICGSLVQNSNVIWGAANTAGTTETTLIPNNTYGASPSYYTDANDETGVDSVLPANPSKGFWAGQRTSSSALAAWYNGAEIKNVTVNSVALPNANMFLLAQSNFGGAGITGGWLPDTISLAFVGGGGISVFNTSLRANSFMQAYGINVY